MNVISTIVLNVISTIVLNVISTIVLNAISTIVLNVISTIDFSPRKPKGMTLISSKRLPSPTVTELFQLLVSLGELCHHQP